MSLNLNAYDTFLAQTQSDRLQKILARYELFKLSMAVPGDIVECGVFKGSGVYTFAKLQHIFRPRTEQKIVGFDFFEAPRKTKFKHKIDQDCLDAHGTGWVSPKQILKNLKNIGIENVELVAGDVIESTRAYAQKNLGFRISLLYIDVDNYEGSLAILKNFYPLVSPGGIIAFDEYALRTFGESDAVDEFFKGKDIQLQCFPWASTPSAYCIKKGF